jgi:hypothetical protein
MSGKDPGDEETQKSARARLSPWRKKLLELVDEVEMEGSSSRQPRGLKPNQRNSGSVGTNG